MDEEQPPVMTVDEVAAYLRIPRGSVYRLAQRGGIPCQKVGRHWRFHRASLDLWLEGQATTHHYGMRSEEESSSAHEISRGPR
jgi:excisionase family DNA binding protein